VIVRVEEQTTMNDFSQQHSIIEMDILANSSPGKSLKLDHYSRTFRREGGDDDAQDDIGKMTTDVQEPIKKYSNAQLDTLHLKSQDRRMTRTNMELWNELQATKADLKAEILSMKDELKDMNKELRLTLQQITLATSTQIKRN